VIPSDEKGLRRSRGSFCLCCISCLRLSQAGTASARVTSSPRAKRGGSAGRKSSPSELASIRECATANGYEVSTRGRIPGAVVEAYEAAH